MSAGGIRDGDVGRAQSPGCIPSRIPIPMATSRGLSGISKRCWDVISSANAQQLTRAFFAVLRLLYTRRPQLLSDISKSCWDANAAARPSFVQVLEMLKDASKLL